MVDKHQLWLPCLCLVNLWRLVWRLKELCYCCCHIFSGFFFIEGTAEDSYRSIQTLGKFNNGVFFSLLITYCSNRQKSNKKTWLDFLQNLLSYVIVGICKKIGFQILTFRFITCYIIYREIFYERIFCTPSYRSLFDSAPVVKEL